MLRLALFTTLAISAFCAPIEKFDDIPSEYIGFNPLKIAENLKVITAKEKQIIEDFITNHKHFNTEQEFIAALKENLPSFSEKVTELKTVLQDKYKQLDEPAQNLFMKIIAKGRELHGEYLAGNIPDLETLKQLAVEYIGDYNKLSADSKAKIDTNFPVLIDFVKSEKVQSFIKQSPANNILSE